MSFKREFENFYKANFGKIKLFSPIFYNFPIGIRFEIGIDGEDRFNYVKQAIYRAVTIFKELFEKENLIYVVVNSFENISTESKYNNIAVIRSLIKVIIDECNYRFVSKSDEFSCNRYVLKTVVKSIDIHKLLEKIVLSELEGENYLSGSVYIFNKHSGIMYFLYDNDGLDVVANDKNKLVRIYKKYNEWILDYDREKIEKTFNKVISRG